MEFKERLKCPNNKNKYYIHITKGGYNKCIMRNKKNGSVLPNCVGYAYGRFMECAGIKECDLSTANAEDWYNHKDKYKRGNVPKLGAVACWRSGKSNNSKDGCGHVAIVEHINSDKTIVISESNYSGTKENGRFFEVKTLKKDYKLTNKIFQGFIYNIYNFEYHIVLPKRGYFKKGDRGEDIKLIDEWLYERYKNKKVLGSYFGIYTEKYIKKFQKYAKEKGIYNGKKAKVDGKIGPLTLKAMQKSGFNY